MTPSEYEELPSMFRHAANLFRLDAVPWTWPPWMTKEKRASMADNFEQYANRFCSGQETRVAVLTPDEVRTIEEIDNLLSHVSGVNDERDTVPILLGLRERWPIVKLAIEREAVIRFVWKMGTW